MALSTDNILTIGFVGGGASTISTLPYLLEGISSSPLREIPVHVIVFDPEGLNEGPAYRPRGEGFSLNQPAGKEMDPFHGGGEKLPHSFLEWLQQTHPNDGHTAESFVRRGIYGEYLQALSSGVRSIVGHNGFSNISLIEVRQKVSGIHEQDSVSGRFVTHTQDGAHTPLDAFVLATGHVFSPRLVHEHYLPAYANTDFESKLAQIAKRPSEKIILGSGASMVDVVCALEHLTKNAQQKITYRVISPYGNTGWPYISAAPAPQGQLVDHLNQLVAEFIGGLAGWYPAGAMRLSLSKAAEKGIAPQYFLKACLDNETVNADGSLVAVTKAFYGNPLSLERYQLIKDLEAGGRIKYDYRLIDGVRAANEKVLLNFGNSQEIIAGDIIDCTTVQRGIRNPETKQFHHPLIANLVGSGIINIARQDARTLDINPVSGKPIYVVGPPTNDVKNGIETFRSGYQEVAGSLCAHFTQALRPQQATAIYERALAK